MTTWYLVARGTAVQRTTSGRIGHVIASASLGSSSCGARIHAFSNDRSRDQWPAASPAVIARPRQKYVPLASDVFSVAAVLRVRNAPLSTIEPKRLSAATWNSYCAAWRTPRHVKAGTASTDAPAAGACRVGGLSFAGAAGAAMRATAAVAASDKPIRLTMNSPDLIGDARRPRGHVSLGENGRRQWLFPATWFQPGSLRAGGHGPHR